MRAIYVYLFCAFFTATAYAKSCPSRHGLIEDVLPLNGEQTLILSGIGGGESELQNVNIADCSQKTVSVPGYYEGIIPLKGDSVLLIPDTSFNTAAIKFNITSGLFTKAFDVLDTVFWNNVFFLLSGQRLAIRYPFGLMHVWNYQSGKLLNRFNMTDMGWFPALGQLGDALIQISSDKEPFLLEIWDSKTGVLVKSFKLPSHASAQKYVPGRVLNIDGIRAVIDYSDGYIEIWNIRDQKIINAFFAHKDWIRAMVLVDAERFATGGQDQIVKIWDWPTGKLVTAFELNQPWDYIQTLAASNNKTLLVGFRGGDLEIL